MKPVLKICGLMRAADVRVCADAGVDIAGFVCEYPVDVPWNLTREQAAALLQKVPASMKRCVVTGGDFEKILSLAQALRPDYIQLHYREDFALTRALADALEPVGVRVIKTLPQDAAQRRAQFGTADIAACAKLLDESGAAYILCDARTAENAAQPGLNADTRLYETVHDSARTPVLLAGGITPENAGGILSSLHPDGIDVMTGVERCPGCKDAGKIAALAQTFYSL